MLNVITFHDFMINEQVNLLARSIFLRYCLLCSGFRFLETTMKINKAFLQILKLKINKDL